MAKKDFKIYIASSWKNVHAVELITDLLEDKGIEVLSFVRNSNEEIQGIDFEHWVHSPAAKKSFEYDTNGAKTADLVIYISPSGKDAAAEVGIPWAVGCPLLGCGQKERISG